MLEIDFRFLSSRSIGKNGFNQKELAEIKQKAKKAFGEVKKQKGELGFSQVIYNHSLLKACLELKKIYSGKFKNLVILGIGGSALGARALAKALKPEAFFPGSFSPKLFVCDNIDPDWLEKIFQITLSEPSLFFAISKSGTTAETSAQLLYLVKKLQARKKDWKKSLIIITDPEKGAFREFARRHQLTSLEIPPELGGRFSVLSPVGLAPGVLLGIEIKRLLQGAQDTERIIFSQNPAPAYLLAGIFWKYAREGFKNLVLMPYSSLLADFSEWFAQLWAESLGKRYSLLGKEVRAGSTPIRALGATDQHSQLQLYLEGPQDKLIVFLRIENFSRQIKIPKPESGLEALEWLSGHSFSELINTEQIATASSLAKNQVPNLTITIPKLDAYHLGALFYLFELVTVVAGRLFQVNPFDQPGVELGKKYTKALLGKKEFAREKTELEKLFAGKSKFILKLKLKK